MGKVRGSKQKPLKKEYIRYDEDHMSVLGFIKVTRILYAAPHEVKVFLKPFPGRPYTDCVEPEKPILILEGDWKTLLKTTFSQVKEGDYVVFDWFPDTVGQHYERD